MDALQTIQSQAEGMNPYELKKEFAGKITLHGAVDVQGWLQRATPQEIKALCMASCAMDAEPYGETPQSLLVMAKAKK